MVGFGPIIQNMETSPQLHGETLGLPLESGANYLYAGNMREQVVTRFRSPEGILVGITITPSMRDRDDGPQE